MEFLYFLSLILKCIRSLLSDITSNFLLYSHLSSLDCMLQVNVPSSGFEAIHFLRREYAAESTNKREAISSLVTTFM
jgi:hypothetical protein